MIGLTSLKAPRNKRSETETSRKLPGRFILRSPKQPPASSHMRHCGEQRREPLNAKPSFPRTDTHARRRNVHCPDNLN
ncbi:hypothetical protein SKAU_G00161350 [Synaphobranchus kaupii]|uniref:Uncharacterized protein n=1 Tax=Synaphobranchus kaupii TaxID=118154 RepID=A0A9Q1IZT4_SYNKA|nr:hypothetical protein SKAU_G00161350 [Synaphobranchus kaupii]